MEEEVIEIVEPEEEKQSNLIGGVDDLDDLVVVTKEDVMGKHDANSTDDGDYSDLTEMSDEDMADVIEVDDADIMGDEPPPKKVKVRKVVRRYPTQYPPTLGGIRI